MADGKYYCGKCERFHVRGKIYKNHQKYKMKPPSEREKEVEDDAINLSEQSEDSDEDSAYFCKKCHRKHYRGKIYENHLKYKEEDHTFEESDSFIMKGKMGEELQVKTSKIDDVLRINIYKYNDLRCSLDISVENDYFKRRDIREFIKEQCF
jgi:uncharacterized Zn finger protein (UPF0148 family)